MYKIAIIDHVGNKAGMDYYDSSLAKGFIENGCNAHVFSNFIGIMPDQITYHNIFEGHSKSGNIMKLYLLLKGVIKASYYSRKNNIDLVIMHLFYANIITLLLMFIPRLFGLNLLIISHDISSFVDNDNKIVQRLIYNIISKHIVVHNQFSYEELLKNIDINVVNKIHIIKHGGYIDHINFNIEKENARKNLGLDINKKYILFFGQIKKVKGLDILLEALALVNEDVNLIVAGKPLQDDMKFYNEIISKNELGHRIIKIIRFIEDDERENLFFASDVNILPYRVIYQSGVLLMAMSYGLPVIASNLSANREIIINNENGLLFESENSIDLAQKIDDFFRDESFKKKLTINSKHTIVSNYSWKDIAEQYIRII